MEFLHHYWMHLTGIIGTIITFLMKEKVMDVIKWFVERVQPEHFKALEEHEKRDDDRFAENKAYIGDVKAEIIQALGQNIGYLREDLKTERASTEKRFEFLEKVYLDSRLGHK